MKSRLRWIMTGVAAWLLVIVQLASAGETLTRRWVYVQTNLQVTENADRLETVLRRAKAAGYNGMVLADYKLNVLDRVTDNFFRNAQRIRALSEELELELVPSIGSFGYSAGILAHDPNLAEGLPVRNMPMVLRDGRGQLPGPTQNMIPGDFEEFRGHLFSGWNFQDEPGQGTFVDRQIKHGGQASLRIENPPGVRGNRRVNKKLSVRPFTQYHASVWIRTEGFESAADVRMFAIGEGGRVLSYNHLGVKRDQDWTEHHVVFNSLESREVLFYIGVWDGQGGRLWMDDARVVEEPFVNLVRREACPLVVTNEDGTLRYEEGSDFAPLHDPRLGNVPYAGEYTVYHAPPQLTVVPGSRIRDGQSLRVSYYHAVIIHDAQVCCSLSDPKVFDILADQVRRIDELFSPRLWMLGHDEIRVANWSAADEQSGKSAGQLLADNVRRSIEIIRQQSQQRRSASGATCSTRITMRVTTTTSCGAISPVHGKGCQPTSRSSTGITDMPGKVCHFLASADTRRSWPVTTITHRPRSETGCFKQAPKITSTESCTRLGGATLATWKRSLAPPGARPTLNEPGRNHCRTESVLRACSSARYVTTQVQRTASVGPTSAR